MDDRALLDPELRRGGRDGQNSPWLNPSAMERVRAQSPITYEANMKTATLILSNVGDCRVAITQSHKLFPALHCAADSSPSSKVVDPAGHDSASYACHRPCSLKTSSFYMKFGIAVPVTEFHLERIRTEANKRNVACQPLIRMWLSEMAG